MSAKIELKTNFEVCGSVSREWDLPSPIATMKDLLRYIGKQLDFDFINPASGNLKEDIEVEKDGKSVRFYPTGLDTPLDNGDTVGVFLMPLGGG